jgi:hypothetical protein
MISIKQLCNCIKAGDGNKISLIHDFFGFYDYRPPMEVSVVTQAGLLQGKHVHVNLITVGDFSYANYQEVDTALQTTRNLYARVNLGVGRALYYSIPASQANGRDHIGSDGEAEDLTNEWTVPNDALDIFFVLTYATSTIGLSRVDGPCDKDAKGMDGSVVAIESDPNTSGFVMAHEAGHYLGLSHVNDGTNLMNPSVPNGGNITNSQGNNMKDHCFVKSGC